MKLIFRLHMGGNLLQDPVFPEVLPSQGSIRKNSGTDVIEMLAVGVRVLDADVGIVTEFLGGH